MLLNLVAVFILTEIALSSGCTDKWGKRCAYLKSHNKCFMKRMQKFCSKTCGNCQETAGSMRFSVHPCDQRNNGRCEDVCIKDGPRAVCSCSKPGFMLHSNGRKCVHPCDQQNNGGCKDECNKKGSQTFCSCSKPGFKLDSDGTTCVHPCDQVTNGGCVDLCIKKGDQAECSCFMEGYKLAEDGVSCVAENILVNETEALNPKCNECDARFMKSGLMQCGSETDFKCQCLNGRLASIKKDGKYICDEASTGVFFKYQVYTDFKPCDPFAPSPMCSENRCDTVAKCHTEEGKISPIYICLMNFCGGCYFDFYDTRANKLTDCYFEDEMDLGP